MNFRLCIRALGLFLMGVGALMALTLLWRIKFEDLNLVAFVWPILLSWIAGGSMFIFSGRPSGEIGRREGFVIVAMGWVLASVFGCLPFMLGEGMSFTDAFFETMSGFSTTGATVIPDVEALDPGIKFWRSLTHWLGGMGILLLFVAIFPFLGMGARKLFTSEVPGPEKEGFSPRIADTARVLWLIYTGLTVAETVLLMFGGMDLYTALCHSFGTLATGGFSTLNSSVAGFDSAFIDGVITVFMMLAGINFSLYFIAFRGRWKEALTDPELKAYLLFFVLAAGLMALDLKLHGGGQYATAGGALRYSTFQAAAILTTTGYATADFETWPSFSKGILLSLMFVGGCAGSTGGNMKVIRVLVGVRHAWQEVFRSLHPHAVLKVKVGQALDDSLVRSIIGFIGLFLTIFLFGGIALTLLTGKDVLTCFTASIASLGNIGPGFGMVGATQNYAWMPDSAKWLLCFLMLIGRLELFTVLVLFLPSFWRD